MLLKKQLSPQNKTLLVDGKTGKESGILWCDLSLFINHVSPILYISDVHVSQSTFYHQT